MPRKLLLCLAIAAVLLAVAANASESGLNDTKFTLAHSASEAGRETFANGDSSGDFEASIAENSASEASLRIQTDASWSQASFEQWLCGNMTRVARIDLQIFPIGPAPLLELPACFYGLTSTLETIKLSGVIVRGNETFNDPLERLAKSLPADVKSFTLLGSKTLTFSGENALVELNTLSRLLPSSTFHLDSQDSWQTSSSRRGALVTEVSITPDSTWTNDTFLNKLCADLTATSTSISVAAYGSLYFLLPDCFYTKAKSIASVSLTSVIIQGNSSQSDPLGRFAKAISSTVTSFSVIKCILLTNTGDRATINWNNISTILTTTSKLDFSSTCLGPGSSLPTLPNYMPVLYLPLTCLTGPLPSPLYASTPLLTDSWTFAAPDNGLTGPIPLGFFGNLNISKPVALYLDLGRNKLSGSIPFGFFSGDLTSMTSLTVSLDSNQLEGPLENLFANATFPPNKMAYWTTNLNNNSFSGPLPTWFTSTMTALTSFQFLCDKCRLNGSLPPTFLSLMGGRRDGTSFTVSLIGNQLSGIVPATFFLTNYAPYSMSVALTGNQLTGLPSNLFTDANFTSTTSIIIKLDSNALTGNLPTSAGLFTATTKLSSYNFLLANNPSLSGTLPSTFLSSFAAASSTLLPFVTIDISNTSMTGTLALPDYTAVPGIKLSVNASYANFLQLTSPSAATSGLTYLYLDNNPSLSGELSDTLFRNNSAFVTLSAANTQLNGTMPDMGTINPPKLSTLNLASTLIDFCNGTRANYTSSVLTKCTLTATSAFYCSTAYPKCTTSVPPPPSPPPIAPPIEPPIAPISPPVEVTPPIAVIPIPPSSIPPAPVPAVPVPTGCSGSTRPSDEWSCIGGTWTFVGSVESTVIVIPSGASTTTIQGNLTSTTVVINGLNSVLAVDGCSSNITIIIELTPEQLKTIGSDGTLQQLLIYSNDSSCNSSISDFAVGTKIKGSSCKKVSVSKESSSDGTVSGLFKIDKSGCSKWWIILVSVIAAVVVLVAIFTLLVMFVPAIRQRIRPFAKRQKAGQQNLN